MKRPIQAADFLLPERAVELEKWAVIACDQHTSDPGYWETLSRFVGDAPSTLKLILPEVFLGRGDEKARADYIIKAMDEYVSARIFRRYCGMVSVQRGVSNGKIRRGILLAVDLEEYSFEKGADSLIRASEGTVLERIPPRVAVRERCRLELPHIMLLYNDPDFTVQKAVNESKETQILYDFDLNMGGGRIRGGLIEDCGLILKSFDRLLSESKGMTGEDILFAVGDGNHSLAAAKQVYENQKKAGKGEECRWVLCEAVNLYDEALQFEPIHRLVKAADAADFLRKLKVKMPSDPIEAVAYTDAFIQEKGFAVDYIHGTDHLHDLAEKLNAAAVELKAMNKAGFFPYIVKNGALPKKTFSMGEAQDKRYYLEAAEIK